MANFTDVLNVSAGEVQKPKPWPTGNYVCQFVGPGKRRHINDETEVMEFTATVRQPMPDVDATALAVTNPVGKNLRCTFFLTPDALYRFKEFMVNDLHIDSQDDTRSLGDMATEVPGKQVIITVGHRMGKDKDGNPALFNEPKGYASV